MNAPLLLNGFAFALLVAPSVLRSDEARASVYVIDRSGEFAATGGSCLPFSALEKPGPKREILSLAKGPAGSTVFLIAYAGDTPHLGLPPVLATQTGDSKPVRFPAEGAKWPFESAGGSADLYIAVFDQADPELAKLTEYSSWLADALKSKDETEILLHSEVIKRRLNHLLRQQGGSELSSKLGGPVTASREQSSSKAATTRSGAKPSTAAGRRGLDRLEQEWREDSRPIRFGPAKPGVLVLPISNADP
jgi:hypothetical protein